MTQYLRIVDGGGRRNRGARVGRRLRAAGRGTGPAPPPAFVPGTESGFATFQTQCAGCHGNPTVERAPSPAAIREMTPEKIYDALTTGMMQAQGRRSPIAQKTRRRRVHERPAARQRATGRRADMPNKCAQQSGADRSGRRARPGTAGATDLSNTRFQPAQRRRPDRRAGAALEAEMGVRLTRPASPPTRSRRSHRAACSSAATTASSIRSTPKTGCVYWSFENGSIVRNALDGRPGAPAQGAARYAVFFGDGHANVFALDAQTGKLLWKTKVDPHFVARITGRREATTTARSSCRCRRPRNSAAAIPTTRAARPAAASSRSMPAPASRSGRPGSYPTSRSRTRRWPTASSLYKPRGRRGLEFADDRSGARRASTSAPATRRRRRRRKRRTPSWRSIINTGKLLWSYQATENDVFMGGCNGPTKSEACPTPMGPDMDIGNSPILKTLPNGKRVLIAGTKDGRRLRPRSRQQRASCCTGSTRAGGR